jgi:hypothetical protein
VKGQDFKGCGKRSLGNRTSLRTVILSEHESATAGEGESKDPEDADNTMPPEKSFSMTLHIWVHDRQQRHC